MSYDPKRDAGSSSIGSVLKLVVGGAAFVAGASYLGVTFYKKMTQSADPIVPSSGGEVSPVHSVLADPSNLYSGLTRQ